MNWPERLSRAHSVLRSYSGSISLPLIEAFDATTRRQHGFYGGMSAVPGSRNLIVSVPLENVVQYLDPSSFDTYPLVGAPIPVGNGPLAIAFGQTLDGPRYFVADLDGNVSEVDATTDQVLATLDVGSTARSIKIFGNYAYVTSAENNRLTIIDATLTRDVVTIDNVGLNGPIGVGVVGDRVYVANAGGNTVTVVNVKPTLEVQDL